MVPSNLAQPGGFQNGMENHQFRLEKEQQKSTWIFFRQKFTKKNMEPIYHLIYFYTSFWLVSNTAKLLQILTQGFDCF